LTRDDWASDEAAPSSLPSSVSADAGTATAGRGDAVARFGRTARSGTGDGAVAFRGGTAAFGATATGLGAGGVAARVVTRNAGFFSAVFFAAIFGVTIFLVAAAFARFFDAAVFFATTAFFVRTLTATRGWRAFEAERAGCFLAAGLRPAGLAADRFDVRLAAAVFPGRAEADRAAFPRKVIARRRAGVPLVFFAIRLPLGSP
jgi:hypothetical protein